MPAGTPSDHHPELPVDPDAPAVQRRAAELLLVLVGGAAGTAARYGIEKWSPARPGAWPVGTFVANVVGAFVLGVLLEALARSGPEVRWRRSLRLLVGTGVCGGLTTYSTFAVETDLLVRHGSSLLAVGYAAGSLLAGVLAAAAGIVVAGRRR